MLLKKKDIIINYYNIIYKYSKFHNKIYFFLRHLDHGGKFINLNFLKKNYYKYYYFNDLSFFKKSLGNIKNEKVLNNYKNENNKNLNFINYYKLNKNFVLRSYSNAKLNFKIVKNINNLNIYIFWNKIFHNNLLLKNKVIDINYFNSYINYFKEFFINYLKKILYNFLFIKFLKKNIKFKFNIKLKNVFKNFYFLLKTNKTNKINKKSKKNILFARIINFYKNKDLIKGDNLKAYLLNLYKIFLKKSHIKLPIFITNLKKKFSLKSKIFTIFTCNKTNKIKIDYYILSFIKKYFIIWNKIKEKKNKIYNLKLNYFSKFFIFLLLNSKVFLYKCLEKKINLKIFYWWKVSNLNSLLNILEIESENLKDNNNNVFIKKKKKTNNYFFFFFNKYKTSIYFWKYAYLRFKLNKEKLYNDTKLKKIINFFNLNSSNFSLNYYIYISFIFNSLKGKKIINFKQFYEKIIFNILFLRSLPIYFFKHINLKMKNLKRMMKINFMIKKLICLDDINIKTYIFLKKSILNFNKIFRSLFFLFFKDFFKNKKNKISKILKKKKAFFYFDKVELLNFKKNKVSCYNLNTILKYIEFSTEIERNPYFFKTNKIYCLYFNFYLNNVIILKKKKKILNHKLINFFFKVFKYLSTYYKKKLLRFTIFCIYIKNLYYNLYTNSAVSYKKYCIYKRKKRLYKKKKYRYIRLVRKYIEKKKKYTMDYFLKCINKKPELLQSVKFNRKIVKYRCESIYRITKQNIRPNYYLKNRIWNWISKRNAKNKWAKLYFKDEKNFIFL